LVPARQLPPNLSKPLGKDFRASSSGFDDRGCSRCERSFPGFDLGIRRLTHQGSIALLEQPAIRAKLVEMRRP